MRSAEESSKWGVWGSTALIPYVPRAILAGEISCDVAIVGGGFAGLSTAIHLAEGGASVSVLEAVEIGHGASGRNGGQVNPGLRASLTDLGRRYGEAGHRLYRMAQEAPDYLAELVVRHNIQAGFVRCGGFKLAHSAPTARLLESAVSELQREGVDAEFLSRDELASRVGSRRYQAGMFDPRSGAVHPLDLAREYSRIASGLGVRIFENSRATSLIKSGGQWQVKTPAGAINAERIVVATNAYTDDLIAGLRQSILPVNSFQIATFPLDDRLDKLILPGGQTAHDTRRLVLYFRKTEDRRMVIGGRASFDSADDLRSKADHDVLRNVLINIFPSLRDVPIEYRWTGLVGITHSRAPHYHEPAPGLHVLVGFNGRGVALTSRAGAWLARHILGQEDNLGFPITPIRQIPFHRFRRPVLNAVMKWHRFMDLLGY